METTGKMLKLLLIVIDGPKIFFFFFCPPRHPQNRRAETNSVAATADPAGRSNKQNFFERFLPSTVMDEINQKPSFIPISQGLSS